MKQHIKKIIGLVVIIFLVAICVLIIKTHQSSKSVNVGRRTDNSGLSKIDSSGTLLSQTDSNVSAIVPYTNNGADLGSPTLYWNNGYISNLNTVTTTFTAIASSTSVLTNSLTVSSLESGRIMFTGTG